MNGEKLTRHSDILITRSIGLGKGAGIQYGSETNRKEKIMPKEKRNNLAIYTLAASILLSSVIVSMNQANAVTKNTKQLTAYIKALDTCLYKVMRYGTSLNDEVSCEFLGTTRF